MRQRRSIVLSFPRRPSRRSHDVRIFMDSRKFRPEQDQETESVLVDHNAFSKGLALVRQPPGLMLDQTLERRKDGRVKVALYA